MEIEKKKRRIGKEENSKVSFQSIQNYSRQKSLVLCHIYCIFLSCYLVSQMLVSYSQSPPPPVPRTRPNVSLPKHRISSAVILGTFLRLPQASLTDHCILVPDPHPFSSCNLCEQASFVVPTPTEKSFRLQRCYEQPPPTYNLSKQPRLPTHKFQSISAPRHTIAIFR
jgi:hypothetical protein